MFDLKHTEVRLSVRLHHYSRMTGPQTTRHRCGVSGWDLCHLFLPAKAMTGLSAAMKLLPVRFSPEFKTRPFHVRRLRVPTAAGLRAPSSGAFCVLCVFNIAI